MHPVISGRPLFRLWITTYADWRPSRWSDVPPCATALELVEDAAYSADEAAVFLEGFNSQLLTAEPPIWAVAVPVVLRYEGDAQPGAAVRGHVFAERELAPLTSCDAGYGQGLGQSPQRSR